MKYISMKMEPKGRRPPTRAMMWGRRYHFLSGMGEGMRLTLEEGRKFVSKRGVVEERGREMSSTGREGGEVMRDTR